ncbi:DNA-packaging protein [Tsuneonella suprasediminis]|uniref:DNA-packaging protein n=1 Tax=Tsuneonella suprasediminis TaxID=2306996 RepID=UPI002F93EB22
MTETALGFLYDADPSKTEQWIGALADTITREERAEMAHDFRYSAHAGQIAPPGDWRVWLVMGGRGFGKTRAGAEWVRSVAESDGTVQIALVGASLGEARSVMVEGESGLVACSPPHCRPLFEPSLHRLRWPNGAQAFLYSAAEPESLRGPQHSHAWCDEIAKWPAAHERAMRCWDNLSLGLRLGGDQRIVATTTPRSTALVRRLVDGAESGDTAITGGATQDNAAHLPTRFIAAMEREYGGTTLGRQELGGELLSETEGALWSRTLLESCRIELAGDPAGDLAGTASRIVIGVDPPASAHGDACGIVVAMLGSDGGAIVLSDASVERASPERWARAVATAARAWQADRVVVEANQGGEMVETVLRAADLALPIRRVHARQGKSARAEPVAALYEAGRVRHAGVFAALEDQLCGLMAGGTYEGPGRSPDRADALVWALSELMLGKPVRVGVTVL